MWRIDTVGKNDKLKLIISYSHLDEEFINKFRMHIDPFKSNGLIEDWYDRKIIAGQVFQDNIDNNLENADIICLFISANFLSSDACKKEKSDAIELRKRKGVEVIPIILSPCGWRDDQQLSPLLALPTDGKAITKFTNHDNAWNEVYKGLKDVIESVNRIKQLRITDEFLHFLQDTELLANAHSQKADVVLEDLFVYPDLEKFDDLFEYEKKITSESLIDQFSHYPKILIAGEGQSGKTSLCKKLFIELRERNYVPIYVSDESNQFRGRIENKLSHAYQDQYENDPLEEIDKRKIVPIVDNFYLAKNKERHINDLSSYEHQIIIVDDIFRLNLRDENLINSYTHFKIMQFSPSLRNKLIEKWTHLKNQEPSDEMPENNLYQNIDNTTESVDAALGKIFGSGIMPAYPFFILSIIATYEIFGQPLDPEITSQGHCYQALIFMYLRKQGVDSDDIDTYLNFLTEVAFFFYKEKKEEIPLTDFKRFMKSYSDEYHLPIKLDVLLKNLNQTQLFTLDSLNNYSIGFKYIYYYFVAKYFAEHMNDQKDTINHIIDNLHINENAYIVIFLNHHSKDVYILDRVISTASSLFKSYDPATLSIEELVFFDDQLELIVQAVIPPENVTPAKERRRRLDNKELIEKENEVEDENDMEDKNGLITELRRSVKTVEVIGRIIRNRSGSLNKTKLENAFRESMNVHFRLLTSFFDLIEDENAEKEIVDFISTRINEIGDEAGKDLGKEKSEKLARTIFWNINFFFIYGLIDKIIKSLGSDKLIEIIEKICDNENTPASFLVKHGILMWYAKNLQTDNIANKIVEADFSGIARKIMEFMIVNHASMHTIGFKEKQKIWDKIGIPSKKLLLQQAKGNKN